MMWWLSYATTQHVSKIESPKATLVLSDEWQGNTWFDLSVFFGLNLLWSNDHVGNEVETVQTKLGEESVKPHEEVGSERLFWIYQGIKLPKLISVQAWAWTPLSPWGFLLQVVKLVPWWFDFFCFCRCHLPAAIVSRFTPSAKDAKHFEAMQNLGLGTWSTSAGEFFWVWNVSLERLWEDLAVGLFPIPNSFRGFWLDATGIPEKSYHLILTCLGFQSVWKDGWTEEVKSFWPFTEWKRACASHCSMVWAHSVLQPNGTISMGWFQWMKIASNDGKRWKQSMAE